MTGETPVLPAPVTEALRVRAHFACRRAARYYNPTNAAVGLRLGGGPAVRIGDVQNGGGTAVLAMADTRTTFSLAQWLIVALLGAIALLLAGGLATSPAPAQAQTGSAGAPSGVFAIAGQITHETYGLYLVDLRNDTICMYEYLGGERRLLRLMAARTFLFDRQLDAYNTEPPPADIQKLVQSARRQKDVPTTRP